MPTFEYKAKQGPAKTVTGSVEAESRSAAAAELEAKGCHPVWIREEEEGAGKTGRPRRCGRIRRRDVTVFSRQLASLTKSGVPILRALATIAGQTDNPAMRRVVGDLESTIRDGSMLSEAMAGYPSVFPELYVNMVRAGESAGLLDTMLFRLAEAREKEDETRRKVQAAMAYPTLVLVVGAVTVLVLLAFFLPKIIGLIEDFEDLPLPTRILIASSDFCAANWYWFVILAGLVAAVFNRLAALERGRMFVDGLKLHLPFMRRFVLESEIARFGRTLSLLIGAGIAIDKALSLSAQTLHNSVLRDEVEHARDATVNQGEPLSSGLRQAPHFPAMVANMCAVGEEAGKLDESLSEIAAYYESEVDQRSRIVTSLLEPILILVVGGVVGFIVAAMLLPIFRLSMGM